MSSCNSSSSSSSSSAKSWEDGVAIFVKYKKKKSKSFYDTTDEGELKRKLKSDLDREDDDPKINRAVVYKTKLEFMESIESIESAKSAESEELPIYHAFVVLQLKNYYISLDKHNIGLTIQVSDEKDYVLSYFRGELRYSAPEMIVEGDGDTNLKDLIDFYVEKDFVTEGYNYWTENHCKKFAGDIFKNVAKNLEYDWQTEERLAKFAALLAVIDRLAGTIEILL